MPIGKRIRGGADASPPARAEAAPSRTAGRPCIAGRVSARRRLGASAYLQPARQVGHALRLGYLMPGDQLPKVRDVVASLATDPNTVLKAYREPETKGLTLGRPSQGTFIEAMLSQAALPQLTAARQAASVA